MIFVMLIVKTYEIKITNFCLYGTAFSMNFKEQKIKGGIDFGLRTRKLRKQWRKEQ